MMRVMYQRLRPDSGPATAAELAAGERRRHVDRAWVGVCMVTSIDGSAVVADRSGALSSAGDMALFDALRAAADVILVGAATARGEGYGPPKRPGQRVGVVTASGRIDGLDELFASGAGFVVMPEDAPTAPVVRGRAVPALRAGRGRVDLAAALRRIDDVVESVTFVQVEGGPQLNAALLDAGCVDELNLTLSPRIAGGAGPRIISGATEAIRNYDLVQLATDDDGFIYGRWTRPLTA